MFGVVTSLKGHTHCLIGYHFKLFKKHWLYILRNQLAHTMQKSLRPSHFDETFSKQFDLTIGTY